MIIGLFNFSFVFWANFGHFYFDGKLPLPLQFSILFLSGYTDFSHNSHNPSITVIKSVLKPYIFCFLNLKKNGFIFYPFFFFPLEETPFFFRLLFKEELTEVETVEHRHTGRAESKARESMQWEGVISPHLNLTVFVYN